MTGRAGEGGGGAPQGGEEEEQVQVQPYSAERGTHDPPNHHLHLSDMTHGEGQLRPAMVFHQCEPGQCDKGLQYP